MTPELHAACRAAGPTVVSGLAAYLEHTAPRLPCLRAAAVRLMLVGIFNDWFGGCEPSGPDDELIALVHALYGDMPHAEFELERLAYDLRISAASGERDPSPIGALAAAAYAEVDAALAASWCVP